MLVTTTDMDKENCVVPAVILYELLDRASQQQKLLNLSGSDLSMLRDALASIKVLRHAVETVTVDPCRPPAGPVHSTTRHEPDVDLRTASGFVGQPEQRRRRPTTSGSFADSSHPQPSSKLSSSRSSSGGGAAAAGPVVNPSRYKTEMCRQFEESGTCRYGEKCQFAHGQSEVRQLTRHPKYKTEMCRTFHSTGFCPYGLRCHFIHNEEERRGFSADDVVVGRPGATASSSPESTSPVVGPVTPRQREFSFSAPSTGYLVCIVPDADADVPPLLPSDQIAGFPLTSHAVLDYPASTSVGYRQQFGWHQGPVDQDAAAEHQLVMHRGRPILARSASMGPAPGEAQSEQTPLYVDFGMTLARSSVDVFDDEQKMDLASHFRHV